MIQISANDSLIVCVDGGATHSRFRVYDQQANTLLSIKNGPASLSLDGLIAYKSISEGLAQIRRDLSLPADWQPAELLMGLAGASREERRQELLDSFSSIDHVYLTVDGHAQVLGAGGGAPSVCLAVGTGSVMVWLDQKLRFHRAGGWGYPVGDEAGACWVGMQALNALCWWLDTPDRNIPTPLFVNLMQRVGDTPAEIQEWTTCHVTTRIASLAETVTAAASVGDSEALNILQSGARWCERLVSLAPGNLPLYLVGGLAEFYRPLLSAGSQGRLRRPVGDALSGLLQKSKTVGMNE